MRVVVVGMGVQGHKRRAIAGKAVTATIDPVYADADKKHITDVPLADYDAALVCAPDEAKIDLLTYLLGNGKHVLVEKPLITSTADELRKLAELARRKSVTCYTAYNHRFEPHFVRMKQTIETGVLGEIYSLRMFYGNGTARLVRDSAWRDKGAGVLPDLGSHLLDTILFWFGKPATSLHIQSSNRFENRSFDHVAFVANGRPLLQLETTLLSWKNHFYADLLAEKCSAHIDSLCKWGPSTFTLRERKLPSGRPDESAITLVQPDPTWQLEYDHFLGLCRNGLSNIENDIWINGVLDGLATEARRLNPPGADA